MHAASYALPLNIAFVSTLFVVWNNNRGFAVAQQCQFANSDCSKSVQFVLFVLPLYNEFFDDSPVMQYGLALLRQLDARSTSDGATKATTTAAFLIDAEGYCEKISHDYDLKKFERYVIKKWREKSNKTRANNTYVDCTESIVRTADRPVVLLVLKTLAIASPIYEAKAKDEHDFVYVSLFRNKFALDKKDVSNPTYAYFIFHDQMEIGKENCTLGNVCHAICGDILGSSSVNLTCPCPDGSKSYWSKIDECKTGATCDCPTTSVTESSAAVTLAVTSHHHHPITPKAWAFLLMGIATIVVACMILASLMRSKGKPGEKAAASCATTRNHYIKVLRGVGKSSCAKVPNVKTDCSSNVVPKKSGNNSECDSYGISASDYRKLMGVEPPKKLDKKSIMMIKKWVTGQSQLKKMSKSSVQQGISKSTDLVLSRKSTKISK